MMMLSLILEHASATYNVSQMCQKPKICFEILDSLCWNGLCSSWHQVFLLCRKWWWTWMVKSLYFSISARLFSSSSLCCLWRSRYRSSSRKYLILRQISKFFGVKITLKFLALALFRLDGDRCPWFWYKESKVTKWTCLDILGTFEFKISLNLVMNYQCNCRHLINLHYYCIIKHFIIQIGIIKNYKM